MIVLIALRQHKLGLFACAAIGGLVTFINAAGFGAIAGTTPYERAQFGAQMELIGRQLSYLLPPPYRLETLGGFLQWRAYGFLPIIFGLWGVLAATGAVRGEEERGLTEAWMSAGVSKAGLLSARVLAFANAVVAALCVTSLGALLGAAFSGAALPPRDIAGQAFALFALSMAAFALGLLLSQFPGTRRGAGLFAGAVLIGLYELNNFGRLAPTIGVFRRISPFFWAEQTQTLAGGRLGLDGTAVLLSITLACSLLALAAWQRRDLGTALITRRGGRSGRSRPQASPLLRLPVVASIYEQRMTLFVWLLGFVLIAIFLASLAGSSAEDLQAIPGLRPFLARLGRGDPRSAMLGFFWFDSASLLLSAFTVVQVSRWAGEDGDGRLEMMLSAPISRTRVIMERLAGLAVTLALLIAAGSSATLLSAYWQGIPLPNAAMLRASLMLLPLALVFGVAGAIITGAASPWHCYRRSPSPATSTMSSAPCFAGPRGASISRSTNSTGRRSARASIGRGSWRC
jgi:polyether ionophore transport system permease protein